MQVILNRVQKIQQNQKNRHEASAEKTATLGKGGNEEELEVLEEKLLLLEEIA